jgi:hypothetical protein
MEGIVLAVMLLAGSCGSTLHQRGQACLASNDTQSAQCAAYWGQGQPQHAAELRAQEKPAPPPALSLQFPPPQGKRQQ